MSEELQIRVHVDGDAALPTLVYLPGTHGDWTLIASFRKHVEGGVRFVEFTYPRTTEWTLKDYAASVEEALLAKGITNGWLVGESFGSQVAWELLARAEQEGGRPHFQADGLILAGGFSRHSQPWLVKLGERLLRHSTQKRAQWFLEMYARYARFRHRHAPETGQAIREFVERRTDEDLQAMAHRLKLIRENNPDAIVERTTLPVYHIAGFWDPIVPKWRVKRWLRAHCPGYRETRILPRADHTVLSTDPGKAAEQVMQWVTGAKQAG